MKEEILQAALLIADRQGWPQVSTRRITKEFGYTTSAIYYYLGGKDQLLTELQRQGFLQLKASMQGAADGQVGHAAGQLRAVSLAFWEFAFTNRSLYQLMFGLAAVACKGASGQEVRQAGAVVQTILGQLSSAKPLDLFMTWWAFSTGFIAIGLNAAPPQQAYVKQRFEESIEQFSQTI